MLGPELDGAHTTECVWLLMVLWLASSSRLCCRAPTGLAVAAVNALKTEPLAKERGIAWPFFEVGIA